MGIRGEKGATGQKGDKGDRGHLGLPVSTPTSCPHLNSRFFFFVCLSFEYALTYCVFLNKVIIAGITYSCIHILVDTDFFFLVLDADFVIIILFKCCIPKIPKLLPTFFTFDLKLCTLCLLFVWFSSMCFEMVSITLGFCSLFLVRKWIFHHLFNIVLCKLVFETFSIIKNNIIL